MAHRCCIWTLLLAAGFQAAASEIDLGNRRELFADRFLVERLEGAELRLHAPHDSGRALAFDAPWEGRYCGYVTVFRDTDRVRMYYRGLPESGKDGSDREVTCYAESADGVEWNKPALDLFPLPGAALNNIVLADTAPFSHNFAPFLDNRPGVAEGERYKALAGTSATGLAAFVSADGLRWRKLSESPVITEGAFDSQNVAFWSEAEKLYVCYLRTWTAGEFAGIRTISRSTSADFLHWTDPVPMDFGGTPMEHLYTNQTLPYFRAPHLYLGFAARFMPGRRVLRPDQAAAVGIESQYAGDCSDTVLLTSRGGNAYDRTFMEGFVRPGIGPAHWTSRTNYAAHGLIQTGAHELSMFVQHEYGQPSAALHRYTLRLDGFASIHAGYAGGEAVTRPFQASGTRLFVNAATSAAGEIRFEVQAPDGSPLPGLALDECVPFIGNETDAEILWRDQDLASAGGGPMRLRIFLKDANIYAIQFR